MGQDSEKIEQDKKRVYLINVTCGFGSTGRIVTGLYDELTNRDCICRIAYGRGSAPAGYDSYRIGDDNSVNIHGVFSRITDRHGFYSNQATKKLIENMQDFKPDIVHLHNIHGYYLNVELLFNYLKESGVKVIWTLHDCWSFTGHCTHFEFVGCDKWKTHCNHCKQLREYPKSYFMDSSEWNFDKKKSLFTGVKDMVLVTPSAWLREKASESYMKEYPVRVVPTGIDLEVFHPTNGHLIEKYKLYGKKILLGVANPWRERKGIDEFVKLSQRLTDDYQIVMVGLKKEQIAAMPDNILALSRTDSVEEMAMWYSAADIYLNLTLEDTFPTTNIEALACGTPVITYRVGGSPESLDEKSGIVVNPCDIDGVISAIDTIVNGSSRHLDCVLRAADFMALKRFSQYYTEVYEPLMK